jgi:integrase
LAPVAVDELRRVKREQVEALLLLGIRQSPSTLVCARRDGEPLQPQSLTHEFPRFLGRLGEDFPRVRFHDLRHTHATLLLESGETRRLFKSGSGTRRSRRRWTSIATSPRQCSSRPRFGSMTRSAVRRVRDSELASMRVRAYLGGIW